MFGHVRERSGAKLSGIVPSNTYRCRDGKYVIIGGNGDSIFQRLMRAAGRADMADDARLLHNPGRVEHEAEIDAAIGAWTAEHSFDEVLSALERAEVPAGPIYSVADIAKDPQYRARKMFEQITLPDGTPLEIPALVPRLSETPGATRTLAPSLGQHNGEVYGGLLGLSEGKISTLREAGVI
jgi:formyl-CoA transferase